MESEQGNCTAEDVLYWLETGESLEDVDLSGGRLERINLSKVSLRGASLENANLRHANLEEAILEHANLKGAKLRGASLKGANLLGADLEGAMLDSAILNNADLREACLKNATLTHASLKSAIIIGANFNSADLRNANLSGAEGCLSKNFKLTEQFFSALSKDKIPESNETIPKKIITTLYELKDQEYSSDRKQTAEEKLLKAVRKKVGKAASVARYRSLILKHAYASLSRKFCNADLRGANVEYTGLDQDELKNAGAKIDTRTIGLNNRVFSFFRASD